MRTNYEILNDLDKSGDLKRLTRGGLIGIKIGMYLDIYRYYDARVKSGVPVTRAAETTAENMKVCRQTVFNVLRTLSNKK